MSYVLFETAEGLYCQEANPMSGGSSEILNPPPPPQAGECVPPPAFKAGWRGGGGSEDARDCSVLYKCKNFVLDTNHFQFFTTESPSR
jgi:hypothetical protein